jgi:hypothetical protein
LKNHEAGAWVEAIPAFANYTMGTASFHTALRYSGMFAPFIS